MPNRPIKIDTHNALVLATAPLLMIVPYLLTFDPGIGLISFFLGAILIGVTLCAVNPRMLPSGMIASFDLGLGLGVLAAGLICGLLGQPVFTTVFLVGYGAAHLALASSTRYGSPGR